jgi:hypothetical protein
MRFGARTATEWNEEFSGDQQCQCGTMFRVLETLPHQGQTGLITRENFLLVK